MKDAFLFVVLSLFCVVVSAALNAGDPSIIPQPKQVSPQPQCVRVLVKDKSKEQPRSQGTGAYIGPDIVITCNHVVKDRASNRVEVLFPDWQLIQGTVVRTDEKLDAAIIQLNQRPIGVEALFVNSKLTASQRLSVQGYSYGPYRQRWGTLNETKYGSWRSLNVPSYNGDSGGPVIDENGRYCGTLWGSADGETFFTPASELTKLIIGE